jgi:transposase-like protein
MGKRGPKPQFIDVACPNEQCSLYGLKGQGNIIGNGTYESRGEKTRKYKCTHCNKVFNDHTDSYFHNLRKDEKTILLALQMSMKGMSIEAIAEVLGIQAATVARWIALASEQCDKVNDNLMNNLEVTKIEMDELWVIIKKNSSANGKL